MKAYIFPGQGAQFPGMGKDLYERSERAKILFESANQFLGFRITDIMFFGNVEELKQTNVTQPAIFLHSVISVLIAESFTPDMVAGHSLGEFSALVANKVLSFEDGLKLVTKRADAMQKACEINPSTMGSKKVPGLYLIGEMLDCDGCIGGFNFQWAWSTGHLAGYHAALATQENKPSKNKLL